MTSLHEEATCLLKHFHFPELSVLSDCIVVVIKFKITQLVTSHLTWHGLLVIPVYLGVQEYTVSEPFQET